VTDTDRTDFVALMHKVEDLDIVLQLCVQEMGNGMTFIKHPLINLPYVPQMNAYNNALYRDKLKVVTELESNKEYEKAIWIYERPFRAQIFNRYTKVMEREQAARLMLDVWQDCEHPYGDRDLWREMFNSYRDTDALSRTRTHLIKEGVEEITLYRGMGSAEVNRKKTGNWGMSWTLDRDIAVWFARRYRGVYKGTPAVAEARFNVRSVFCYMPERGEQEVVADPLNIIGFKTTDIRK